MQITYLISLSRNEQHIIREKPKFWETFCCTSGTCLLSVLLETNYVKTHTYFISCVSTLWWQNINCNTTLLEHVKRIMMFKLFSEHYKCFREHYEYKCKWHWWENISSLGKAASKRKNWLSCFQFSMVVQAIHWKIQVCCTTYIYNILLQNWRAFHFVTDILPARETTLLELNLRNWQNEKSLRYFA